MRRERPAMPKLTLNLTIEIETDSGRVSVKDCSWRSNGNSMSLSSFKHEISSLFGQPEQLNIKQTPYAPPNPTIQGEVDLHSVLSSIGLDQAKMNDVVQRYSRDQLLKLAAWVEEVAKTQGCSNKAALYLSTLGKKKGKGG